MNRTTYQNHHRSMSTQKMSYFSDIDLATLHRSRLNERIQYKLSWFNRRQKYCIPAASKSVCKRDNTNATTPTKKIKTYANNIDKFNTNAKNTCQSINGLNGMKASNMSNNDLAKLTTAVENRQQKNGYTNNNRSKKNNLTSDRLKDHLSDDSTTLANEIVYQKYNEPAILNVNRSLVNQSKISKNCEGIQTLTNSNQSTDRFTLNNSNVDSSKRHSPVDCHTVKCSSDSAAINRIAQMHDVMSSKRNATPLAGGKGVDIPVIVEQIAAIEEQDLELPHRKRSGTWP